MRRLDFRVSYNVTLFNFIDCLSKWDYFVGGHIHQYFGKYYGLVPADENSLRKYAEVRNKLGWEKEMELFDWAYGGFTYHPEFSQLEETLHYFEQRADEDGMLLKSELEHATEQLQAVMEDVEARFLDLGVERIIGQFTDLFESPDKNGVLPSYLTYSPVIDSSLGGTNGEGIYTQVSTELERGVQVRQAAAVIAHEYMHKELNPGRYFQFHPDEDKRQIYNKKYPSVYPDEYYQFVEEVVVHTLNDVISFKVDPEDKRDHYNARYKDDEDRRRHFVALWQAAHDVKGILVDFVDGKLKKDEAISKLDDYFIGLTRYNVHNY